jgi:hypothetical protein
MDFTDMDWIYLVQDVVDKQHPVKNKHMRCIKLVTNLTV